MQNFRFMLLISVASLLPACRGDPPGAASLDELIEIYREAHHEQSIDKLRTILIWEVGRFPWHRSSNERYLRALFEFPLVAAEYVELPEISPDRPAVMAYDRLDPSMPPQRTSTIGEVPAKVILTLERSGSEETEAVVVDPAYGIVRYEGRHYLAPVPQITKDAVESLQERRDPLWEAVPPDELWAPYDLRERARRRAEQDETPPPEQ